MSVSSVGTNPTERGRNTLRKQFGEETDSNHLYLGSRLHGGDLKHTVVWNSAEQYAKSMDSGLGDISGAGWTVKTQADRGKAHQNLTLGLLEHPGCVDWR